MTTTTSTTLSAAALPEEHNDDKDDRHGKRKAARTNQSPTKNNNNNNNNKKNSKTKRAKTISTISSPSPSLPLGSLESTRPVPVTPDSTPSAANDDGADDASSFSSSSSTSSSSSRSTPRKSSPAAKKKGRGKAKTTTSTTTTTSKNKNKTDKHTIQPPNEDWQAIYQLVEELRSDRTAPVDTNGSEALPQKDLGEKTYRFQVLIALMLSSQTKDNVVGETMRQLQQHGDGLTLDHIRNHTTYEQLNQVIFRVGFHNTKAKNILLVADILHQRYGGDIPPTAADMIRDLPGVGPKMAYIVEHVAWGRQTGIGIDTHMHRMFNQLKWVQSTTQPEHTRLQLESWLPQEYWPTVNLLWVGLGQEVQQYPEKILTKALNCSRPKAALHLLKRLGMDVRKVGAKIERLDQVNAVLKETSKES